MKFLKTFFLFLLLGGDYSLDTTHQLCLSSIAPDGGVNIIFRLMPSPFQVTVFSGGSALMAAIVISCIICYRYVYWWNIAVAGSIAGTD